jgi:hypothetical protein
VTSVVCSKFAVISTFLHKLTRDLGARKLKCYGEFPQCSRCKTEGIRCVYSPRKKMGRPRKRRRDEQIPTPEEIRDDSSTNSAPFSTYNQLPDFAVNGFMPLPPAYTSGPGYTYTNDRQFHESSNLLVDPYLQDAVTAGVSMPASSVSNSLSANQHIQFSPPESDSGVLPCSCLSSMYLTLSGLQTMSDFTFPMVLPLMRSACSTAYNVLRCEHCPLDRSTASSNLMLLTTVLTCVVDRYDRVLKDITLQADRAEQSGETIPFRMGENRPETAHLHTGTLDCPMGFDIDLSSREWRKLARKVVKADVLGPAPHGRQSVLDLVNLFEERQHQWHLRPDVEHLRAHYERLHGPLHNENNCLKFVEVVRQHIRLLDLDQAGDGSIE